MVPVYQHSQQFLDCRGKTEIKTEWRSLYRCHSMKLLVNSWQPFYVLFDSLLVVPVQISEFTNIDNSTSKLCILTAWPVETKFIRTLSKRCQKGVKNWPQYIDLHWNAQAYSIMTWQLLHDHFINEREIWAGIISSFVVPLLGTTWWLIICCLQ